MFHREFHVLASPDGSCPDDLDYSTDDKTILWSDCPILFNMELGSYSTTILGENVSGNNQELLKICTSEDVVFIPIVPSIILKNAVNCGIYIILINRRYYL